MKFRHGVIVGVISGFVLSSLAENAARKRMEKDGSEKDVIAFQGRVAAYKEGFLDGKNWTRAYHKIRHPECDSCPH